MVIGNIPVEIIILILNELNYPTCLLLAITCKSLHNIIHNDGFWKHKIIANFGGDLGLKILPYQKRYFRLAIYEGYIYPGAEEYIYMYSIAQRYCDIDVRYTTYFLDKFSPREFSEALTSMSETGNMNSVESLLDKCNWDYNWTPSYCDYSWNVAFAARSGDIDMVRLMLEMLKDKIQVGGINEMNEMFTSTAIMGIRQGVRWAEVKGYMDIAQLLNSFRAS